MTDVQLEQATERLQRKLNLTDPDGDTLALLGDELLDAEESCSSTWAGRPWMRP